VTVVEVAVVVLETSTLLGEIILYTCPPPNPGKGPGLQFITAGLVAWDGLKSELYLWISDTVRIIAIPIT